MAARNGSGRNEECEKGEMIAWDVTVEGGSDRVGTSDEGPK